MNSASQEPSRPTEKATLKSAAPEVPCDLCGGAMALPEHCREQGEILGLLVCTNCIEEQLEAQSYERTCQAH